MRLFVKTGSLQEADNQLGLAHFLEHMAFNGIKHFKANELIRFLESKGAKFGHDLNAHTSFQETIYKLKIPTRDIQVVDSTLTILSDWVDGMLLDSLEVEKERGVILSEWLSKQSPKLNSSQAFLDQLLNGSLYSNRKVIGDTTILRNFKHSELKQFYNQWYDPSIMAIAISGDIDVNKVEELIKKKFESKKTTSPNWKEHPIPSYTKDSLLIYSDSWVTKTELNYIQLIPPLRDVASINLYEQYLTRTIINSLFKERFAKLSKGKTFYTDGSISIGNFLPVKGAIIATVELDSSNLKKGIEQFNTHLGQLYTYGFTNQEIEKTKKNLYRLFNVKYRLKSLLRLLL